jgi:hypothetical protein
MGLRDARKISHTRKFLIPQSTRLVFGRRGFIRIDSEKDFLIFDRGSCVYYYEQAQTSDDELLTDGGKWYYVVENYNY